MNNKLETSLKGNEKLPKLIWFLQKIESRYKVSINDILKNQNISYEDFKSALFRINWIIKDYPKNQRNIHSETVYIKWVWVDWEEHILYLPPKNKEKYLEKLYNIYIDTNIDTQTKSMMLYYGLQYIHFFSDGNKRTGRTISTLVNKWFPAENTDWNDILQDEWWWKTFDFPNRIDILWEINKKAYEKYFKSKWIEAPKFSLYLKTKNYTINTDLKKYEKYEEAQKILDANYIWDGLSFRAIVLYFINKNAIENDEFYDENSYKGRTKRKVKWNKKSKISKFSWEKLLNNLKEEYLDFIIKEHNIFEEIRMNIILDNKEMKEIVW